MVGIFLYDSYFSGKTSEELDIQLALLYAHHETELKVNIVPMQQQRGGADCGVFAAAVCLAITLGPILQLLDGARLTCVYIYHNVYRTKILHHFPQYGNEVVKK